MATHTESRAWPFSASFPPIAVTAAVVVAITGLTILAAPSTLHAQEQPVWRFSILASVKDTLVQRFGGFDSICVLIHEQIEAVNRVYNGYEVFDGTFEFSVDSIQTFTRNRYTQAELPHPGFDYHIVYDCALQNLANWLHPPANAILLVTYHTDEMPAPFTRLVNYVLAHELCHSRGAIDLYALTVDFTLNAVNGQGYSVEHSIMSGYLPGGWAPHTINIVNRHTDQVLTLEEHSLGPYFAESISTRVVDVNGLPVPNAEINIYEHQWYDYDLADTPLFSLQCDSGGVLEWDINYFQWGRESLEPPNAWGVVNSVMLFEVTWQGYTQYAWLSLVDMNLAWFADSTADFVQTITMPFDVTDPDRPLGLPGDFVLRQNYPNPFNASTTVCVDQGHSGSLRLEVLNALGQVTTVLHDGPSDDGAHCYLWDATSAASGVYFCRARFDGVEHTVKMMLVN